VPYLYCLELAASLSAIHTKHTIVKKEKNKKLTTTLRVHILIFTRQLTWFPVTLNEVLFNIQTL
jgi:hypothetical protein